MGEKESVIPHVSRMIADDVGDKNRSRLKMSRVDVFKDESLKSFLSSVFFAECPGKAVSVECRRP